MEARSIDRADLRFTDATDGDLRTEAARAAIHAGPWTTLRQVHGDRVVVVDAPGAHAGERADAAVTNVDDAPLVVMTADCAPVALVADGGAVVGVAHAGWRGLVAGVLPRTVDAMRDVLGATGRIAAVLGPCIHVECYEFGDGDLDAVARELGDTVRGETREGRPALDVPASVAASLRLAGVDELDVIDVCTSCAATTHWSHRARGDTGRQGVVAWRSASTS